MKKPLGGYWREMITSQKVNNWWECLQCRRQFEIGSDVPGYTVGDKGYYCENCMKSGITWAIAMAYKENQNER